MRRWGQSVLNGQRVSLILDMILYPSLDIYLYKFLIITVILHTHVLASLMNLQLDQGEGPLSSSQWTRNKNVCLFIQAFMTSYELQLHFKAQFSFQIKDKFICDFHLPIIILNC